MSGEARPIRVAIIEDNREFRESLYQLIRGTPGYACVGAWSDVEWALQRMEREPPDVVLLDIGLPGMSGIEGVAHIRRCFPTTEVIMLTVYDDDDAVLAALCAGASGYLLKDATPVRILEAIREVHEGGAPMTPRIARKVLHLFRQVPPPSTADYRLTAREQEVLRALVDGKSYKQIALQMGITVETVRTHIKNIYHKLQVHSKSQAVAKALRERLV